jgi:hypothetical protein
MRFPGRYSILLACLAAATVHAQEFRGTFSGSVTDRQGAAVAKAKVTATEVDTGVITSTLTETSGAYTIPFLPPGAYSIKAEAAGFKVAIRQGLTLSTGERPVIDIVLDVGEMSQSVTVTAEVPMVESSTGSTGQVITTEEVDDMPLNGMTPLMLGRLAMGVISTNEPGPVRPFDNGAASSFTMGGTAAQTSEILINGAPNSGFSRQMAYSPPQGSVTEVRAYSFESDAAFGHTGGGTINVMTKSGTNAVHGSAYEYLQVSNLEANPFFDNAHGIPRAAYHYDQFGINAGGPVYLPKLFNGKDKVFWFFAYEGLRDSDPINAPAEGGPTYVTVPTAAERTGDFSALLRLNTANTSYQIYDPASGVTQGSRTARTPFPNNIIPAGRLSPIAQKYLQYWPLPNLPGTAQGDQNFGILNTDSDTYDNELGRGDFNFSSRSRLSLDLRHNYRAQNKNNYFSNIAEGNFLYRRNYGVTLDEVYSLNSSTVLDIRADYTRFNESNVGPADGFDPAALGFPAYLSTDSEFLTMPHITLSNYQSLGENGSNNTPYDTWQVFGDVVKIHGNHTTKIGADLRLYRESQYSHGSSSGNFTFSTNWVRGPLDNSASSPFGQDLASFLLGLPTSGSLDYNTHNTTQAKYAAVFVQDDWRVAPGLTVNLGLRFEHEGPAYERYSRTSDGFDPTAVNAVAGPAFQAYQKAPVAQIPAGQFRALGGLTFSNPGSPAVYNTASYIFSPRFGFAWSPKFLGNTTVLRGGFGVFVAPIGIANTTSVNQQGFSQTTQELITNNNYLSPASTLSDPFPNGILLPAGASAGPSTFLGQQVKFLAPNERNSYSMRWNFGIQRQLPGQFVLEVAYIGNHAVHLMISDTNLNPIPRQYLSPALARDNSVVNILSASVANPFQGLLPNSSSLNGGTVALSQLLLPFPQFPSGSGVDMQNAPSGESYFNSLNVRLQKRFTHGITMIQNFMYSSMIERVSYLNDTDTAPEKRVSGDSRPLRETLAMTWEVPMGRGHAFNPQSRVLNAIFGGWSVNGALSLQSGPPLSWGNVFYYGGPLHFQPHQPNGSTFDTTQFVTASSLQPSDNIRYFDTYFNNLRRDPTKNLDASVLKRVGLGERRYLQLRFETFNVTNRVTFSAPQLSPTNSAFGQISSQANNPRKIQLAARVVW